MVLRRFSSGNVSKGIALFGSVVIAAALAFFGYIGTFSRFWADDYCYSALINQYGWLNGIKMYYLTSGNRFSTIATVGLIDLLGPRVISFLPVSLLAFWVIAWYVFLNGVRRLLSWKVERAWLLWIAFLQVYFVALLSPDRLQVIYWRMGNLHYSFPMSFLLLQLGLTAGYFQHSSQNPPKSRSARWAAPVIGGIAAFYNGGQSETSSFMQAGIYAVLLVGAWFLLRDRRRALAARLLVAPLIGSLLAILVLSLSPFNADRLRYMPPPDNLLLIIPYSIRYVFEFFFYSIRGQIIPYLVLSAACLAVSLFLLVKYDLRLSWRSIGIGLLLSLILTVFFAALSFAPSAYANLQYPGPRNLMPGCFILLAGIGASSFFLSAAGYRLLQRLPAARLQSAALIVILCASLYPIYAARSLVMEKQTLSTWAARWDARDQQIRQAVASGDFDVETKQIEVVRTLEDLGPQWNYWLNACAAVYYGAHSIVANP